MLANSNTENGWLPLHRVLQSQPVFKKRKGLRPFAICYTFAIVPIRRLFAAWEVCNLSIQKRTGEFE